MTIGPEPMIRIFERSVLFGILNHLEEFLEEIVRVVRTRRCLRMILNAEGRHRSVFHPFNGVVVQIEVRNIDLVQVQTFRIDREAVILCGNLYLLALEIQHRMIAAVMAEFQLVRFAAESEAHDLMAKADSEDWFLSQQFTHISDRIIDGFRIAWSV